MRYGLLLLLLFVFPLGLASAQDEACAAIAEQIVTVLDENCDVMDVNQSCYGHVLVDATFRDVEPAPQFVQEGDVADVLNMDTISTSPFDEATGDWGLAVLNVQANLPNTIPGQAVVMLLVGEVNVENGVLPENAFEPGDVLTAEVLVESANVRRSPSTNGTVLGTVTLGTTLEADARSDNQEWLRVWTQYGAAWINRYIVELTDGAYDELPVASPNRATPMQVFRFSTGVGVPSCESVPPSALVIQSPENAVVNITANGVDIVLGSTAILRTTANGAMQIITVDGTARSGPVTVPPGYTAFHPLDESGTATGVWQDVRPLTDDELTLFQRFESFQGDYLHRPLVLPTRAEINAITSAIRSASPSPVPPVYNTITTIVIPAGGPASSGDFAITSPLDGFAWGQTTFYWDPYPTATRYRLLIYNDSGSEIFSTSVNAPDTFVTVDTAALPNSALYCWEVQAYVNDQLEATSAQVCVPRELPPPPAPPSSSYPSAPPDDPVSVAMLSLNDASQTLLSTISLGFLGVFSGLLGVARLRRRRARKD